MQYKPKKIFANNVFLFNTHVQYKLQKFLAKPVFFAGLVFWFTAHVQYKDQKIYFAIILPASIRCLGFVRFAAFKLIFEEDMVWPEKHLATLSWLPDQLIYILHSRVVDCPTQL